MTVKDGAQNELASNCYHDRFNFLIIIYAE